MRFFVFIILSTLLTVIYTDDCVVPLVSGTTSYSSKSSELSSETVYIIEFALSFPVSCVSDGKGLALYAEIGPGELKPVAFIRGTNTYQISWSRDHKKAITGDIPIKIFGFEGRSAYLKAQETNEDVSAVVALFTLNINHPGISKEGLFVRTEFVAVVVALLIWWGSSTILNRIFE